MRPLERQRFDLLLEEIIDELPEALHRLLEEAPLIVEDRPSRRLLEQLGVELDFDAEAETLCGLHSGTPLTERSVAGGHDMPEMIHIFREGIVEHAGGWDEGVDEDGMMCGGTAAISTQIRITLLHEIGHHFGLGEEDLAQLGYE